MAYQIETGSIPRGHFIPAMWEPVDFGDFGLDVVNSFETREDAWNAVEEAADPYDYIFARRSHKRNVLELDGTYVRVVKA